MSCSSLQTDFEKIVNYYSVDEEPGPPTVYIEVMKPAMLPPVDKRGMSLNYKFHQESIYKRFYKMVGETRALESIFGRVKMPPIYPPDIVVTDPDGNVIERHTFDTPIPSDEIIVKSIEEKRHELLVTYGIVEEGDIGSIESIFEEILDRTSFEHGAIEEEDDYSIGSLEEILDRTSFEHCEIEEVDRYSIRSLGETLDRTSFEHGAIEEMDDYSIGSLGEILDRTSSEHGESEEVDRYSILSLGEILDRTSSEHGESEEVDRYSIRSLGEILDRTPFEHSLEEISKDGELYKNLPSETQNNKELDEPANLTVNQLDAYITPAKIIHEIEDGIHSQAFWNSSERFLKSRLKTAKRLGIDNKEVKFLKGKLKSFDKVKLARNVLWKNEIIDLNIHKKEEDIIFPMHKQERTELIKYAKDQTVELWENQKAMMAEFLDEKDSTNKILLKGIETIELNCKDFDEKILKIKRKLKQVWRLFGKRKLRAKLSKYEEMREKYGEMLDDMKTKIEKRGAFTLF